MTLEKFYSELQKHKGDQYLIPHFDFSHGASLNSKVLFLLESPGPQVRETGDIALTNNDQTARNLAKQLEESRAHLKDIVLWNIVPWILRNGVGFAAPTAAEIKEARPFTLLLFEVFPNITTIVFLGRRSQREIPFYSGHSSCRLLAAHHPSPQGMAQPDRWAENVAVFERLKATSQSSTSSQNHAFIDLQGVVLHHRTGSVLSLMDIFLRGLRHNGWQLNIFTSHTVEQAEAMIAGKNLPSDMRIVSTCGRAKGVALREEIRRIGNGQYLFLDDKPANLASVREQCSEVRAIGFVGSGKYCPKLSDWCYRNRVELGLSVPDLFEGLEVSNEPSGGWVKAVSHLSEEDLALLITGLDHPRSAIAGETPHFDHRPVINQLLERRKIADFPRFWENIAWITCRDCLLKVLIESVIKWLGLERTDVLGNAYTCNEYLVALREFVAKDREIERDFKSAFNKAFASTDRGISQIGAAAENCRISRRPIDIDRLEFARTKVSECLGLGR